MVVLFQALYGQIKTPGGGNSSFDLEVFNLPDQEKVKTGQVARGNCSGCR